MHRRIKRYTASIILGPEDMVPLIMDTEKSSPHFWRFPSGVAKHGHTESQTANLVVNDLGLKTDRFHFLSLESKSFTRTCLLCCRVESFVTLKEPDNAQFKLRFFNVYELRGLSNLLPIHHRLLNKAGLIKVA